jgi:membrane fusion protein (multidrug efflux system)
MALGQAVDVTADGWPQRTFPGRVTAINATVDPATRNIQVEATVRNPKRELLPGMFVRASVSLGGKQHLITLPQAAIAYNPYGATVFIAKSSKDAKGAPVEVAQQVFVTPGPTRGDQVGILKGVDESAVVVTSGQLKLRNGTPLIVNNATSPLNDPNPTPQEH